MVFQAQRLPELKGARKKEREKEGPLHSLKSIRLGFGRIKPDAPPNAGSQRHDENILLIHLFTQENDARNLSSPVAEKSRRYNTGPAPFRSASLGPAKNNTGGAARPDGKAIWNLKPAFRGFY